MEDKNVAQSSVKRGIIDDLVAIDKSLDCGVVYDEMLPLAVKDTFRDHFAARLKLPASFRLKLNMQFPKRLSNDQVEVLDSGVTRAEIREAVWGCGVNKSPGPDGYTFEFFRRYWNIIGPDFCDAVEGFFDDGFFPKAFGFGPNWCKWIRGIFTSAMTSVLINGSPTSEFPFFYGLKQGAAPLYYMSIYKVPKGVLHELESIRSKFFNGIDPLERKITWIAWEKVLASKKNGGLG
nr:RNA-directed DNA polymerase, eukaryota [Tanacetum cinerariifolium]